MAELAQFGTDTLLSVGDRRLFRRLQALRVVLSAAIVIFLAQLLDLDLHIGWFLIAAAAGVLVAGRFLRRGRGILHALFVHAFVAIMTSALLSVTNAVMTGSPSAPPDYDFLIPRLADQLSLLFLTYSAAFLATWWFWVRRSAATGEGVLLCSLFVWLLSGHRNYHLDAPKQISSLTWKLSILQRYQVEPQHLFMGLGVCTLIILTLYFLLASDRPIFGSLREIRSRGRRRWISALIIPAILFVAMGAYLKNLNARYNQELSRRSEGVSQAPKEGESNLGFHKAVGHTNQPTALVRLEGDFAKNPWAPMLYLREGALSEFNGHEFVAAGAQFDLDVPRTDPSQPFISLESEASDLREKLVYSVYLLTRHNTPPAIDSPRRITLVKNPDPNRFQLGYQVVSMTPTVKPTDLLGRMVGDQKWDQATLAHYLRAPGSLEPNPPADIAVNPTAPVPDRNNEDLRYLGLTRQLTGNQTDPLARAESILNFLSNESIYTRDPGHEIPADADPVAPYLFAEKKRGYCVHFAHAAVYMLRLAGVPARIGTGYLTDLQYAKDGHILLQMGDRHAWPEIYIEGLGWTIWDVNPAQAENETPPVPDPQLLEELMGKLNPTDELIAPPQVAEPKPEEPSVIEKVLAKDVLLPIGLSLLTAFLLIKLWLRAGYLTARSPRRRTRLAYLSFATQMDDMGFGRTTGETRQEFRSRIETRLGASAQTLTTLHERFVYAREAPAASPAEISAALKSWRESHDTKGSRIRRYLSFFNPRSILRFGSW